MSTVASTTGDTEDGPRRGPEGGDQHTLHTHPKVSPPPLTTFLVPRIRSLQSPVGLSNHRDEGPKCPGESGVHQSLSVNPHQTQKVLLSKDFQWGSRPDSYRPMSVPPFVSFSFLEGQSFVCRPSTPTPADTWDLGFDVP